MTSSDAPRSSSWKVDGFRKLGEEQRAQAAAGAPEPAWADANLKKRIIKALAKTDSTDPVEIAKQVRASLGYHLNSEAALRSALLISVLVVLNGQDGGQGVPGEPETW